METRRERYSNLDEKENSRVSRNGELYKNMYEDTDYTNIEGITNIGRTNRVDIRTIRGMLNEDNNPLPRRSSTISSNNHEPIKPAEEKDYDVKDILDKAKNKRNKDDKARNLDAINKLLARIDAEKEDSDIETDSQDINDLMNTLTSTLALKNMSNKELSESILDLPDATTEIVNTKEFDNEDTTLDTSFYTTTNKLQKTDLADEIQDDEESTPKSHWVGVTLLTILIVLVLAAIIYYFLHLQ